MGNQWSESNIGQKDFFGHFLVPQVHCATFFASARSVAWIILVSLLTPYCTPFSYSALGIYCPSCGLFIMVDLRCIPIPPTIYWWGLVLSKIEEQSNDNNLMATPINCGFQFILLRRLLFWIEPLILTVPFYLLSTYLFLSKGRRKKMRKTWWRGRNRCLVWFLFMREIILWLRNCPNLFATTVGYLHCRKLTWIILVSSWALNNFSQGGVVCV